MAADYQISTAGEHSPDAAPAVAGAVLIHDLLLVLEGDFSPNIPARVSPKAQPLFSRLQLLSFRFCPVGRSAAHMG